MKICFPYRYDFCNGELVWRGINVFVSDGVLPPWFSTEICIRGMDIFQKQLDFKTVLEIGTGCGFISIYVLLHFFPETLIATDIDTNAVSCAERNIIRYKNFIQSDYQILKSDLFSNLDDKKYSLVIITVALTFNNYCQISYIEVL